MLILGIETSCDETAAAIVKDGREVLSNVVFSQIQKHQEWGGVIPEIASRLHLEKILPIIKSSLDEAKVSMQEIDAIAVSSKPGLVGSLLIGVNAAKTLAWIHKKPIIPINHLFGHICANYIDSDLEPPFVCLLASGGHTQIIKVPNFTEIEIIGETIDDAAGEAFDKVARLMDLPYPGGPHLDKLAQTAFESVKEDNNAANSLCKEIRNKYKLPIAKVKGYDFSFSGLKTAVLRLKEKIAQDEWEQNKAQIAHAFQHCVAETFKQKISAAMEESNIHKLVIAGGVAANSEMRKVFKAHFTEDQLCFPGLKYCTDNAAMIASAGYFAKADAIEPDESNLDFEVLARV